jgi:hypothetical protein
MPKLEGLSKTEPGDSHLRGEYLQHTYLRHTYLQLTYLQLTYLQLTYFSNTPDAFSCFFPTKILKAFFLCVVCANYLSHP